MLSPGLETCVAEVHEEHQEVSRGRRTVAIQVRGTWVGHGEFARTVVLRCTRSEVVCVGVGAPHTVKRTLACVAQDGVRIEVARIGVVATKGRAVCCTRGSVVHPRGLPVAWQVVAVAERRGQ